MIEAIHIGPEEAGALQPVESVRVLAGKGVEGDRHFAAGRREARAGADARRGRERRGRRRSRPARSRRQLTTRGVRLNDLVGKHFKVGDVECYGVELCEPCTHLESMTRPGIIKELVHRAGLNADVLTDGVIRVGDALTT